MTAYLADPQCTEKKDAARGARKAVRRAIEAAKRYWIDGALSVVNADGTMATVGGKPMTPQAVWCAIRALQRGVRQVEEVRPLRLRKDQNGPDPALCESVVENRKLMLGHLKTVFSQGVSTLQ